MSVADGMLRASSDPSYPDQGSTKGDDERNDERDDERDDESQAALLWRNVYVRQVRLSHPGIIGGEVRHRAPDGGQTVCPTAVILRLTEAMRCV